MPRTDDQTDSNARVVTRLFKATCAALVTAGVFVVANPSGADERALPAQIVDIDPPTSFQKHPTTDFQSEDAGPDGRRGTTRWRVVKDTGNCCENHFATTPDGLILDVGGSFVNFTPDLGATWKSVRPIEPLVNGEGSIVIAPNGDILVIEWDPSSGDHLLAYKYNAEVGKWYYMENILHHPFFDRPWISVVPGPFTNEIGEEIPYITFVQGGFPLKDPMFVSNDGLTYLETSSLILDGTTNPDVEEWFPIQADASFDWIQPIQRSPVTPLGAGRALGAGGWLFDPEGRNWHPWQLRDGSQPPSFIQIDSNGRIHNPRPTGDGRLEYRISGDGGRSWNSTVFDLDFGGQLDFKVNLAAGVSAIGMRLNNSDRVYKFDITGDTPRLIRVHQVGLGDLESSVGLSTSSEPRFDFQSLGILPDGRVVTSFMDSTTESNPPGSGMLGAIAPAAAIEIDTTFSSDVVTEMIRMITANPAFTERTAAFDLLLENVSERSILEPIRAEVIEIRSASGEVTVDNADNGLAAEGAFWRYDGQVVGDELSPAESSGPRRLAFAADGEPFSVLLDVIGKLPAADGGSDDGDGGAVSTDDTSGDLADGTLEGDGEVVDSAWGGSLEGAISTVFRITVDPAAASVEITVVDMNFLL